MIPWNNFVESHPAAHFLQLREWGRFKEQFGWTSSIVTMGGSEINGPGDVLAHQNIINPPEITSGAQILYRPLLSRSPFNTIPTLKLAYIPKGPLVDWHNPDAVNGLFAAIEAECRQRGAGILKIEPNLSDTVTNRSLLAGYGFRPSPQTIQPQSTMLLNISGTEDEILGKMKSKWRYNIRLAERKEVTVRTAAAADLSAFNELMQTTGERNGFHVHEPDYYVEAFNTFAPRYATFLLAEYQGQPLASVVVMAVGKTAWYPWGASSNVERNRMPNYALYWAAIRWAKSQGATLYDFWGIPDRIGQLGMSMAQATDQGIPAAEVPVDLQNLPQGELWGVYRLKQGFGGNVYRSVGAWDKPIQAPAYALYQMGLALRQRIPQTKRKLQALFSTDAKKEIG